MAWSDLEDLLEAFVQAGAASAVAASVQTLGRREVFSFFYGNTRGDAEGRPIDPSTRFDLASLTKVFATTTHIARLVDQGRLDLAEDVRAEFPELSWNGGVDTRIDPILRHQAGFSWWMDFSRASSSQEVFRSIAANPPAYAPDTTSVYSDLGFILLGEFLARRYEEPLDRQVMRGFDETLGTHGFSYRPLDRGVPVSKIVATEQVLERGGAIQGVVHDRNTERLGGVAGHAGLFGTLDDCARLSMLWLRAVREESSWLSSSVAHAFLRRYRAKDGKARALGWDVPTQPGSMAGANVSDDAYGHSGYTGTSSWIDVRRGAVVVLLTNRVHPRDEKKAIAELRPAFHDAVWKELDG